jgi:chromosome transmission fidelity protein 1
MPSVTTEEAALMARHDIIIKMEEPNESRDFHHPYTPYQIQEEFMETAYGVLETGNGQVGILESPTGTGKSLSLICASMTWLREFKAKKFQDGLDWQPEETDEPDWIVEQAKARRKRELLRQREHMEARLARIREKEKAERAKQLRQPNGKRRKKDEDPQNGSLGDEDQFVLDDYESDQETSKGEAKNDVTSSLSATTLEMMKSLGMYRDKGEEEDLEESEEEVKVFYCSRTHSQLTQFINELRRANFPPALPPEESASPPSPGVDIEEIKQLTLGSRKNLCINPSVTKLGSVAAMNERCVELQQETTASGKKCPYVPNQDNQGLVASFRDHALATIRDIEELGDLGRTLGICPYYASRSAIKSSEIVTLPYNLLFQKSAREALGISLKGHVVIVDEAHNLMDTISGIHSISIELAQLKRSKGQLGVYLQKFRNKLKGKNRVYVAQIVRLIASLEAYLEAKAGIAPAEGVVEPTDLLKGNGVDQINLYKLLRYLNESKLARKVEGYVSFTQEKLKENVSTNDTYAAANDGTPTLHHIASLIAELNNPSAEGQFFYSHAPQTAKSDGSTTLKYLLLDPTHSFQATVSEARAVILAGGTMSPMSDYTSHLLSYLQRTQIATLSCGHVIPKENLVAWTLGSGPTGKEFQFTYDKRAGREGEEMLDDLGRGLLNICSVVPDGVVVFFPSYSYLDMVKKRWERAGADVQKSVWERLGSKKALFTDGRDAKVGEDVLTEYAAAIDTGKGALLLSVVGGKLSEGINFSDRLGRCVVIVGLPFPNVQSPEWKAKLRYVEDSTAKRLVGSGVSEPESKARGKQAAREFYENACMRAVNQSVGRAIRHREDYAAIVMIDQRFGKERIKAKLPGWIQAGLVKDAEYKPFAKLMGELSAFFRTKK